MQDFELIDTVDKIDLIIDEGVILASRKNGYFDISLFQIDSFYVEVYLHTGQGKISLVRCFDDADGLDGYLSNIDIDDLIMA
jgi:hypothetical protein